MRLLRLCEREGSMDLGAYRTLRDDITLAEALEIEAGLCVIGDQRSAFCEFYKDLTKEELEHPGVRINTPQTPAKAADQDMREEISRREAAIVRDERLIMGHRAAVAYAASGQTEPAGRLARGVVDVITAGIASNKQVVTYLTGVLDGK